VVLGLRLQAMAEDEGTYELRDDGDMAEVKGAPGDGWGKGPRPGDPDFVPPEVVVVAGSSAAAEAAEEEKEVGAAGEVNAKKPKEPVPLTPEELDVQQNKAVAILGYICFVIPLVTAPQSAFARFHANQGLISSLLWVTAVFGCVACWAINLLVGTVLADIVILAMFFSCLLHLLQPAMLFGALAMMIKGILNAADGQKKELPVVGTWRLIK
jgi:uncharacterized membrane protein